MVFKKLGNVIVILVLFTATVVMADDIGDALTKGKTSLDLRYRFESVSQDGKEKNAAASTFRLRLGYTTGKFYGFNLHVDMETIQAIGGENYDSTANSKVEYPIVADPADTELNQAFLAYTGVPNTVFKLGRQRIKIDNDRFIGNVGWRQNEQTYDAFQIINTSISNLTVTLAYITNVNRIFGEHHSTLSDINMNTGILNFRYDFLLGGLSAYGYFLDNKDSPVSSHRTLGLRFTGSHNFSGLTKVLYTLEHAVQDEYKDGVDLIGAYYYLVELGLVWNNLTVKGGYEVLGSEGIIGFATPLATLHAFNGWADKFLSTPSEGLIDLYFQLDYKLKARGRPIVLSVVYHEFNSDHASISYGTEIDFQLLYTLGKNSSLILKYAGYFADEFASNTTKFWAGFQYKF
jgi:hypothetical protein